MKIISLEQLKEAYYKLEKELARAQEKIGKLKKRLVEQKENEKK